MEKELKVEKENKVDLNVKKDDADLKTNSSEGIFDIKDEDFYVVDTIEDGEVVEDASKSFYEAGNEDVRVYEGLVPLKKTKQPYIRNGEKREATVLHFVYKNPVNGKFKLYEVYMEATDNKRSIYDIIDDIYGNDVYHDMDIVKKTITRNEKGKVKKRETYSAQISGKNDLGAKMVCPLKPKTTADQIMFDNLISILKFKETIS